MFRKPFVLSNGIDRIALRCKEHFIVLPVNTAMALSADHHTAVQFIPGVMLAKSGAPVHLSGNQVMKIKRRPAMAERAVIFAFVVFKTWSFHFVSVSE